MWCGVWCGLRLGEKGMRMTGERSEGEMRGVRSKGAEGESG